MNSGISFGNIIVVII